MIVELLSATVNRFLTFAIAFVKESLNVNYSRHAIISQSVYSKLANTSQKFISHLTHPC